MNLHFGTPQIAIGIVFACLAAFFAIAFAIIATQAGREVSVERVHRVGYWLRTRWFVVLVVIGVVVMAVSLFDLPYSRGDGSDRTVVDVTAGQYYWVFSPSKVPAGTPVRFTVTSVDVNHGMGLYDPDGHLVGSVQAMPGYRNELDLTLTEPGAYHVRCLELCGFSHSTMESTFTVTGR